MTFKFKVSTATGSV